jgi:hypothetical protein
MIFINGMVLRLKKLAARSGSSATLHRFIGHILLCVLSGNTCVLPTLGKDDHILKFLFCTTFQINLIRILVSLSMQGGKVDYILKC